MNKKEKREYEDLFHVWSEWIYSLDITKVPDNVKQEIGMSEHDYQEASKAYFCRLKEGIILVNEAMPDWEIRKDVLLALNRMPHDLLQDIYGMESLRYKGVKPEVDKTNDAGEKMRRLLYFCYIPELLLAHETNKKKHI